MLKIVADLGSDGYSWVAYENYFYAARDVQMTDERGPGPEYTMVLVEWETLAEVRRLMGLNKHEEALVVLISAQLRG